MKKNENAEYPEATQLTYCRKRKTATSKRTQREIQKQVRRQVSFTIRFKNS